jgi:hypothetical protein
MCGRRPAARWLAARQLRTGPLLARSRAGKSQDGANGKGAKNNGRAIPGTRPRRTLSAADRSTCSAAALKTSACGRIAVTVHTAAGTRPGRFAAGFLRETGLEGASAPRPSRPSHFRVGWPCRAMCASSLDVAMYPCAWAGRAAWLQIVAWPHVSVHGTVCPVHSVPRALPAKGTRQHFGWSKGGHGRH